jgi:hypothetical protein
MDDRKGIEAQGDLGEQTREATVQAQMQAQGEKGVVVNINTIEGCKNLPVVDLGTKEGFESVKTCETVNEAVDHLMLLQVDEKMAPTKVINNRNNAAEKIVDHAKEIQEKGGWREGLKKDASVEEVKTELQERSKLAVPDNVANNREGLEARLTSEMTKSPSLWNLDEKMADLASAIAARVQQLLPRIVGIGKDYKELKEHGEGAATKPVSAAEGSSKLEKLAMPQPEPATSAGTIGPEPANPPSSSPASASTSAPGSASAPSPASGSSSSGPGAPPASGPGPSGSFTPTGGVH